MIDVGGLCLSATTFDNPTDYGGCADLGPAIAAADGGGCDVVLAVPRRPHRQPGRVGRAHRALEGALPKDQPRIGPPPRPRGGGLPVEHDPRRRRGTVTAVPALQWARRRRARRAGLVNVRGDLWLRPSRPRTHSMRSISAGTTPLGPRWPGSGGSATPTTPCSTRAGPRSRVGSDGSSSPLSAEREPGGGPPASWLAARPRRPPICWDHFPDWPPRGASLTAFRGRGALLLPGHDPSPPGGVEHRGAGRGTRRTPRSLLSDWSCSAHGLGRRHSLLGPLGADRRHVCLPLQPPDAGVTRT